MYKTLIEDYDYDDEDIWVLNLDGSYYGSYKEHFDPYDDPGEIENYMAAYIDNFSSALDNINSELQNNDINLVFIYISGHQGGIGSGPDPDRYNFKDGNLLASEFADTVETHLLANNVNSKTLCIYVMGSCAAWGFYSDLNSVTSTISFAAADDSIGWNTINTDPSHSFMHYWQEAVDNNNNYDIDLAFNYAEEEVSDYYPLIDDDPIKGVSPSGWDDDWTLSGPVTPNPPTSLNVTGYNIPKSYLYWQDNSSNETGFKVYRSVNDGEYSLLETLGANVTTYNDYDISDGNTYSYKVAAYRTISGWTSSSACTNDAELLLICWIEGPSSLLYREDGTWYAHYAGQPQGNASFQWYKRYNYSNWAAQGTDSSQTLEMRTTDFWVRLDVTISSVTVSDSIYVVFDDSKRLTENDVLKMPTEFFLHTNYPNPFNPETIIHFELPKEILVRLSIYDISGREITILQNEKMAAGHHQVRFNASHLASGIYFYKITAGEFSDIRRMLLIK
jgi:hypothetical protein